MKVLPVILKGQRAGTGCWSWNGSVKLSSNTELEKYIAATSFSLENKQAFETAH